MRSKYSKDELLIQTAKKKVRLQNLIDNLPDMSEDDIMKISEQLWIKEALLILKRANNKGQKERLSDLVYNWNKHQEQLEVIRQEQRLETYQVWCWTSEKTMIVEETDSPFKSEIEVNYGDDFYFYKNKILFKGSYHNINRNTIIANSKLVNDMTLDEFNTYYQNKLGEKLC